MLFRSIGGLKEKSMAAYRGGVKRVFIPHDNIPDLDEVDGKVRENLEFIPVKYVTEIIDQALLPLDDDTQKSDTYITSQTANTTAIRN